MSYNPAIPAANDDPSVSQGEIQTNFSTINTAFGLNHVALGSGGSQGKHKFMQMPVQATIPAGLVSGEGTLYTKAVSGISQLFYSPDNSGNEYQLTRTISGGFSRFGTNTNYQVGPPSLGGGWTYLPGGLILQYGFATSINSPGSGTINFPVAFTAGCYSLVITPIRNSSNVDIVYAQSTAGLSSFTYRNTAAGIADFYWMAIGS